MTENNLETYKPTTQDYEFWIEMGWWTPEEAWFVFLNLSPEAAVDFMYRERALYMHNGKKIKNLIDRAVVDFQIEGLQRVGGSFSGYYRAPCRSWISWAEIKKTIPLSPSLLQVISHETKTQQQSEEEELKIFNNRNFHPDIIIHAGKSYKEGNFPSSVFECAKAFEKAVQKKSKIETFGESLMSKAFSLGKGTLKLNSQISETEKNEQEGIMHLAIGFIKGIKNPQSHEPVIDWPISKNDALDILSFLSFLWRQLDICQYEPRP